MAFPPCPTILMVRKLPADLSKEESTDLLQYFGAKSVSVMSSKGHMKGTAFAEFGSREEADIALKKLHQAPLFGSRLVVQYSDKNFMPFDASDSVILPSPSKPADDSQQTDGLSSKTTPDPSLHYLYPPPTSQTLSNISHALVAVPQFYIQVLHLMNKMNLPPPFSKSAEKSIFESNVSLPPPLPSSSESELESDPEEPPDLAESKKLEMEKEIFKEKRIATQAFIEKHLPESERKRKRELSEPCLDHELEKKSKTDISEKGESSPSCAIEAVDMDLSDNENTDSIEVSKAKPIEIETSSINSPKKSGRSCQLSVLTNENPGIICKSSSDKGKVDFENPVIEQPIASSESVIDKPTSSTKPFIDLSTSSSGPLIDKPTLSSELSQTEENSIGKSSKARLKTSLQLHAELSEAEMMAKLQKEKFLEYQTSVKSKCLTPDKFAEHAVFKKYVKGDPSQKLYIKNLNHKQVVEQDLKDLFMPYFEFFNHDSQKGEPELQIKLMTRGQMKGQAFITFPNVEASEAALSDLHGYILHGKPMAIMFAKSK